MIQMERLLTPEEVADAMQISEYKVRDLLRKGKLKGVKIDGQWRIRTSDYKQYLDSLGEQKDKK